MLFTNINNCLYFFSNFKNISVGRTTVNIEISGDGLNIGGPNSP